MKTKLKQYLIITLMLTILCSILTNKQLIYQTCFYSMKLWTKNLVPSLFPFFIISNILTDYHITNYIPNFIKKTLTKLFNVSEETITIFFLSLLSGFPSNAIITKNLYNDKIITKEEAEHALTFTHFANPLFIISTVAVLFLNNEQYGYIILLSHYLGNILIALITRFSSHPHQKNYTKKYYKSQSFSQILIKAIRSTIDTLLLILGTLTCFLIVSSLIIQKLNISPYNSALLKGIIEITMGLKEISILNIQDIYKVTISTMFISFGGFNVHLQVISQIVDTDLSYHSFFIARIFHTLFSGIIAFSLFKIYF